MTHPYFDLRCARCVIVFDIKDLVSEHGVGGKPTRLNISSVVSTIGAFDGSASKLLVVPEWKDIRLVILRN